jgi:hypothetical protein
MDRTFGQTATPISRAEAARKPVDGAGGAELARDLLHIYDAVSNFSPHAAGWSTIPAIRFRSAPGTRSAPAPL